MKFELHTKNEIVNNEFEGASMMLVSGDRIVNMDFASSCFDNEEKAKMTLGFGIEQLMRIAYMTEEQYSEWEKSQNNEAH